MQGYIHSIDSFGTVDGPGVRFVIFFQGCPMRCLYCHNPDTWTANQNKRMSTEELLNIYNHNKAFYQNGGITATGGEPMLQLDFLTELFTKAKQKNIHTCLDTSGICFNPEKPELIHDLLAVTDLIMLDIKHIDDNKHKALTGHSNQNILAFAEYISNQKNIPVWIRHVILPDWTDNPDEQLELGWFIGGLKTLKALDCLPYHDMGKQKYQQLGMTYALENTKPVSQETALQAKQQILKGIKKRLLADYKK
ncbi:MAG: pyruvate formate lyase-activating protein [Oscillospiraceae bacterium]|nr:pyruvate formate lyase-activating protein [Oscillospiraceae bacterium]MDE6658388.1 pyruvate formate lyase-activating protein [Oscillospiraceae bacterium]